MAPTEVLAKSSTTNPLPCLFFSHLRIEMQVVLVTGSMTAKEKRLAYEKIASHEADIIVGEPHALIQEKCIMTGWPWSLPMSSTGSA